MWTSIQDDSIEAMAFFHIGSTRSTAVNLTACGWWAMLVASGAFLPTESYSNAVVKCFSILLGALLYQLRRHCAGNSVSLRMFRMLFAAYTRLNTDCEWSSLRVRKRRLTVTNLSTQVVKELNLLGSVQRNFRNLRLFVLWFQISL